MSVKKIMSIILTLSILAFSLGMQGVVFGRTVEDTSIKYYSYANKLSEVGVLQGTGDGLDLERAPSRIEALIILIRMLGVEDQALEMTDLLCPFPDVDNWAKGYASYAYKVGLTKGYDNGLFGQNDLVSSKAFITFMLRSLGYDDSQGDFQYETADKFAHMIGLLDDNLNVELVEDDFLRNLVAKIAYNTLLTPMKSSELSLNQYLVGKGSMNGDIDLKDIKAVEVPVDDKVLVEAEGNTENSTAEKSPVGEVSNDTNGIGESDKAVAEVVELSLLGPATATKLQLETWARSKGMSEEGIDLIDIYYDLCEQKGLNPVIQYVQMCYETGWLYKSGISQAGLDASFHNPCGLKTSIGGDDYDATAHTIFDTWYDGIDAHTDHTALYAGIDGYPRVDTKDPRHFSYLFGIATTVEALSTNWAPAGTYHVTIIKFYNEVLALTN